MAESLTGEEAVGTALPVSSSARLGSAGRPKWLLVTPAVVLVLTAFCYPAIIMAVRSLNDPILGLQNYAWLLGSDTALAILRRTLIVAGLVTALCLVLGYPYAYLMSKSGPKARAVLTLFVLMPFWTSLMVRTFAWVIILQEQGILNSMLGFVGLPSLSLLRTTPGVMIGMCQVLMPFMVLPLYSGMRTIDPRVTEAAQIMGARPWKSFIKVYFPLSLPGALAGSFMVFILSLGFYITPAILGSPRQQLLPNALASQISELLNWGRGGALAVALLVCAGGMLLLVAGLLRRVMGSVSLEGRLDS